MKYLFDEPSISADGRYVAYMTRASNIPGGATSGRRNVYRHDRLTGTIELASQATDGTAAVAHCYIGGMSSDGSWIVFGTTSAGLMPGLPTGSNRIYIRRVDERWTDIVSVDQNGDSLITIAGEPVVSGDGQFVAYRTDDPGAIPGDTNAHFDTILRDRGFGTRSAGGEYCFSFPNSTGEAAETVVGGSNRLADQFLILQAKELPHFSLGYFLFSRMPGNVPGFGGSQGRLCLGGNLFRLSSFVQSSGNFGTVTLAFPFQQLPPGAMLAPGDLWHFQYWFRDSQGGNPTSNTSSAVCVPFF